MTGVWCFMRLADASAAISYTDPHGRSKTCHLSPDDDDRFFLTTIAASEINDLTVRTHCIHDPSTDKVKRVATFLGAIAVIDPDGVLTTIHNDCVWSPE